MSAPRVALPAFVSSWLGMPHHSAYSVFFPVAPHVLNIAASAEALAEMLVEEGMPASAALRDGRWGVAVLVPGPCDDPWMAPGAGGPAPF